MMLKKCSLKKQADYEKFPILWEPAELTCRNNRGNTRAKHIFNILEMFYVFMHKSLLISLK